MKKIKIQKISILISILIMCILLLSGCQYLPGGSSNNEGPTVNYKHGTKGVEIKFQKDMPPEEMFLNQQFSLGMEIKNDGATDVLEGFVTIINTEPTYMDILEGDTTTKPLGGLLPGKNSYNPDGGYRFINYNFKNVGIPEFEQSHTFLFKAQTCYKYSTSATATVCINPRHYEFFNFVSAACNVKDVRLSGGQGGPIEVTQVSQRLIPSDGDSLELQFFIEIQNANGGIVTPILDYDKECQKEPVPRIGLDQIKPGNIRVSFSNNILDTCKAPIVDDDNPNKAVITCDTTITKNQGSFTTPLVIQLDYGYVSKEYEKKVTVNRYTLEDECQNCIDKSIFGVCSVFGGEDTSMVCTDPKKACCKRPESQPDCGFSPGLTEYVCINMPCNDEDMKNNACPGKDNYCCKKDSAPDCPSENCLAEGECEKGFGAVNHEKKCANDLKCCLYSKSEEEWCGKVEGTENYECMSDNLWGYKCQAHLCQDETNYLCCGYYEVNCPSNNCKKAKGCYYGYDGINLDANVRCEEEGAFCCKKPLFPDGMTSFPVDKKNWCEYSYAYKCTYDTKLHTDDCVNYLCPGSAKCCPVPETVPQTP